MRLKMSITKGQKLILFLFFMMSLILVGFLQYKEVLIQSVEKVHSAFIVASIDDYKNKDIEGISYYYKENLKEEDFKEISSITQKMIQEVNKNFAQETRQDFNVIIYPNSMEMNSGLKLSSKESTLGAYYGGNIFILSPAQLIGMDTDLENIILHEYTHLLVEKKTKGYHPVWFTEGVALYQEFLITGYEWGENVDYTKTFYTIEELGNQFYQLDIFHAYRSSFLRVRFIAENYGERVLLEIMDELANGNNYQASIKKILGKDHKELENYFMLWYEGNFYDKL